jgi:hypothetical protein
MPRFVKHMNLAQESWLPGSAYEALAWAIKNWYDALPTSLHFSKAALRARGEARQIAGVGLMHLLYHQTLCELNSIGIPDMVEKATKTKFEFPPEQTAFVKRVQETCFEHAAGISVILKNLLEQQEESRQQQQPHSHSLLLVDTWMPVMAYDSVRLIATILTRKLGHSTEREFMYRPHGVFCLQTSLQALKAMIPIM